MTATANFSCFWHGSATETEIVELEEDAIEQLIINSVTEELFHVFVDGVRQRCYSGGVPHLQQQWLKVGYQPGTFWIGRFDGDQHVTQRYNSTFTQCANTQWQLTTVNFYNALPTFVVENVRSDVTIHEFLRAIDVTHGDWLHQEFLDDGSQAPLYGHREVVIGTTGFNVRVAIATVVRELHPLSGFVAVAVDWQNLGEQAGFEIGETCHKEILFTDWVGISLSDARLMGETKFISFESGNPPDLTEIIR
ncbi:hypothetical protein D3C75_832940 [compost metagenome]